RPRSSRCKTSSGREPAGPRRPIGRGALPPKRCPDDDPAHHRPRPGGTPLEPSGGIRSNRPPGGATAVGPSLEAIWREGDRPVATGLYAETEAAAATRSGPSPHRDLFLISFLILFAELACIRWFGSTVIFLTFFTNIVLLASFLGMSVGLMTATRRRDL